MADHTHAEPSDEFDCPLCRAGLLEAFRTTPAPVVPAPAGLEGRCPICEQDKEDIEVHMFAVHSRPAPDPNRCPICGELRADMDWHLKAMHSATVETHIIGVLVRPGLWEVGCSCGWSRSGASGHSHRDRLVAQRLAESWAARHLDNPLEGTSDQ
jgi:hypothetical protein